MFGITPNPLIEGNYILIFYTIFFCGKVNFRKLMDIIVISDKVTLITFHVDMPLFKCQNLSVFPFFIT